MSPSHGPVALREMCLLDSVKKKKLTTARISARRELRQFEASQQTDRKERLSAGKRVGRAAESKTLMSSPP